MEALKYTTDTKACVVSRGAVENTAAMFRELFPNAKTAFVVADPRTYAVAGARVQALLGAAGVSVDLHMLGEDGRPFHAEYGLVENVREAMRASEGVPVAVGSGTINDLVKRSSDELGRRYMVVGTAASMDGYTSYGAAITKDGIKQTMSCRGPLGCIVDSEIAAAAPAEMVASGYADLIAKIPAGADWMIADAIGNEAIHKVAWDFVQGPLRDSLAHPAQCAAGDVGETEKLCMGLVMSGFAMQAMNSSRPASGTEHQVSHYWDMENLCFSGQPVSHGFKVGIGTLASTASIEFLLEQDLSNLNVDAAVARWWPNYESLAATFPKVFGERPFHIEHARDEMAKKYTDPEGLRRELTIVKENWREISDKVRAQIIPFGVVRDSLKAVGAPYEPEMIGITHERFRETFAGVPFMRSRYFAVDLIMRVGLFDKLLDRLFGPAGIWPAAGVNP